MYLDKEFNAQSLQNKISTICLIYRFYLINNFLKKCLLCLLKMNFGVTNIIW